MSQDKKTRLNAVAYIIERLLAGENDLEKLKYDAAVKFQLNGKVKGTEIMENFPKDQLSDDLIRLLKRKPMRTLSGVTPIAVMIKPEGSCTWQCIFCPFTGKAAKSYTGDEPAALRARQNDFDSFNQATMRLNQFHLNGHATDKCDVIVMGGTFLAMAPDYKYNFIKGIYDALNGVRSSTLEMAKQINETAKHRVIGLTVETRPDVCTRSHIDEILSYGATRVELGVQHPDDELYRKTKRGHLTSHVVQATADLKNSAFKVLYHIMPGLPGSDKKKDISMVKKLFDDQQFRPDMLKIYPTLVVPGTELYEMTKRGEFTPYDAEKAADIISEFYRYIPKYVRVMRIQRDIPAPNIAEGVKKSNLREMVEAAMRKKGIKPMEIRIREVGLQKKEPSSLELKRIDYDASGGREIFLSYETTEDYIAGFIRMRVDSASHRPEINGQTALIRELHVYGKEVGLGLQGQSAQHKGLGRKLLEEAERVALEDFDKKKMVIISGVGVREYYYKNGYAPCGPYVSKNLK